MQATSKNLMAFAVAFAHSANLDDPENEGVKLTACLIKKVWDRLVAEGKLDPRQEMDRNWVTTMGKGIAEFSKEKIGTRTEDPQDTLISVSAHCQRALRTLEIPDHLTLAHLVSEMLDLETVAVTTNNPR